MGNPWNERFGAEQYVYGKEPNQFIQSKISVLENCHNIVAFAEGEGRNAVFLAQNGHQVTAYDYAINGLSKTKALAEHSNVNVNTAQKDLIKDEVPLEEFDGAIMVFGHFDKKEQKTVFDKLVSTVKPSGIVMLEVYSEDQLRYKTGGPKIAEMLYNPSDLLKWSHGYKILHFFYGEQERREGELHTGMGHVIQLILQKEKIK